MGPARAWHARVGRDGLRRGEVAAALDPDAQLHALRVVPHRARTDDADTLRLTWSPYRVNVYPTFSVLCFTSSTGDT